MTETLIDIGANLTSPRFHKDLDAALTRAKDAGVDTILVTGTSLSGSREGLALARDYPGFLYATAGVHPHDAKTWDDSAVEALAGLARSPEVVALGECGLDFNRDFSPRDAQLHCFEAQLSLAAELGKPVFLHQRDAHEAFMPILRRYRDRLPGAVVHCFTGSGEELDDYLALDCHIGITGWLCDERRGGELRELVSRIPAERLMIETDAPYLTPRNLDQKPKGNRNEPALLPWVLQALAECRGEEQEMLARAVTDTTRRFFNLS
ncbi:TatD family hydrolase [Marinimicrobium sp. C2-29]|uniref:TatD family hydrolase n=1 Tax=Marinimicrobium sp. C2-29 TaxID=3139825 RepID=UPI003139078A